MDSPRIRQPVTVSLGDTRLKMAASTYDYIFNLDMVPVNGSIVPSDYAGTVYADVNSLGYRSPEFDSAELVYAGCSQTFGIGLPERDLIWGSKVANAIGVSYANISGPGWSTEKVVRMIFAYLAKNKNPKYLVCLFPNITRAEVVINEKFNRIGRGLQPPFGDDEVYRAVYPATYEPYEQRDISLVDRRPYEVENVNVYENSIRSGLQAINMLKVYCDSHGIQFYWSSWDGMFRDLAKTLDRSDYVHVDIEKEDGGFFLYPCHSNEREACPEVFDIGADRNLGDFNAHMGAHEALHYAEAFLGKLKV